MATHGIAVKNGVHRAWVGEESNLLPHEHNSKKEAWKCGHRSVNPTTPEEELDGLYLASLSPKEHAIHALKEIHPELSEAEVASLFAEASK